MADRTDVINPPEIDLLLPPLLDIADSPPPIPWIRFAAATEDVDIGT
jgi:hypothetical protein